MFLWGYLSEQQLSNICRVRCISILLHMSMPFFLIIAFYISLYSLKMRVSFCKWMLLLMNENDFCSVPTVKDISMVRGPKCLRISLACAWLQSEFSNQKYVTAGKALKISLKTNGVFLFVFFIYGLLPLWDRHNSAWFRHNSLVWCGKWSSFNLQGMNIWPHIEFRPWCSWCVWPYHNHLLTHFVVTIYTPTPDKRPRKWHHRG